MSRFAVSFSLSLAIAIVVFAGSIKMSTGVPLPIASQWWAREAIIKKRMLANEIDEKKILIASGSNGLFGLRAQFLAAAFERPAVNLSVAGGMGLGVIVSDIKHFARAGDMVVMPLESYVFLSREVDNSFSAAVAHSIEARYENELSIAQKFEFLRLLPPKHYLVAAWYRFFPPQSYPPGYDVGKINSWGDFEQGNEVRTAAIPGVDSGISLSDTTVPLDETIVCSPDNRRFKTIPVIVDLINWSKQNDVDVIFTWPTGINQPSTRTASSVCEMKRIRSIVVSNGGNFVGSIQDSLLPLDQIFDMYLHANAKGAAARTGRFIKALCEVRRCPSHWSISVDRLVSAQGK